MERPILDLSGERFANMSDQQRAKAIFGSQFKLVGNLSKWREEHPEEYGRARACSQETGVVGESPEQRAERHRQQSVIHQPAAPLSKETEAARVEFDAEKCRQMFNSDGADKLQKKDPAAYQRLKASAASFGVIGANNAFHVTDAAKGHAAAPTAPPPPKPKRTPPPPVVIDPRVAEHVGLTKGENGKWYASWETWVEYNRIVAAMTP